MSLMLIISYSILLHFTCLATWVITGGFMYILMGLYSLLCYNWTHKFFTKKLNNYISI
jgi:hypothetical protein